MEMLGLDGAVSHNRADRAIVGATADEQALTAGIKFFENPQHHDLAYQSGVPFLNRLRRDGGGGAVASGGSGGVAVGLDGQEGVDLGNGTMRMPNGHIRSIVRGGSGGGGSVAGSGARMGDVMMRRLYGTEAPVAQGGGKGSLDIALHGFPAGTNPRASMDDRFRDVNVT